VSTTVVLEDQMYDDQAGSLWWIFLITGTLWLILSMVMFRFNIHSVNTIGILAGIVFLCAGVIEFGMIFAVKGGWWKVLNALLALILIVAGIMSFIHPGNAFTAIASIIGFVFLFVGVFDVIVAFADRTGLWWIRLIIGLLCIGLAFWASGDFDRKAILLVTWIGLFALLRGINSFVVAFTVRHIHKELTAG
jgi:uncharacterized membrane protein HdeD (DUF308 family)